MRMAELTWREVCGLKQPGMHRVGKGLYLQITKAGSKSYILRYRLNGRSREMGLGGFDLVGLAEARDVANDYRKLVKQGIDPIEYRNGERLRRKMAQHARYLRLPDIWRIGCQRH